MARVAAVAVVLACAAVTAAVALGAQSPASLRDAIFTAARAQHSVHYTSRSTGAGGSVTVVADAASAQGVQRITLRKNGRTGRATVLVVRRRAYLRGDAFTLRGFFGLSRSQAARFAHRWITITHASRAYGTVAAAVTLRSFLTEIYPQANLVPVSGSVGGQQVVGVRGVSLHEGESVVETVYARTEGTPLPVEVRETGSTGFAGLTSVGPWNRPVRVQAPGHAVAISHVLGS